MKNNFDLKGYMKQNQVGSYQQLNEMWYQDINQALGDFNVIKEETVEETEEMEEGKKQLAFVIPCPDCYDIEEEAEYFQHLLDKAGVKAKVKANQVGEEAEVYTKDEKKARKVIEKNGYQIGWNDEVEDNGEGESMQSDDQEQSHYLDIPTGPDKGWKNETSLEEKGDVKSIGDTGKMAHANTRTNLGRHRSSDTLDKQVAKDHDKKTVVGAKAAAYKAPHMKEEEEKELNLNDVNKEIVITPYELEKTWNDVYGEDFKTEYSGAYSYLNKNYKNFTIVDLGDVWERMYGENFLHEYPGISKWLFSNEGKPSSKDKVAPKMNEDDIMSDKDFVDSIDANWDGDAETLDWEKDVEGKQVGSWTAGLEPQAGSIVWESPKYNALIYATPGWEGVDGIAVEMYELDADGYMDGEPMLQKVVGAGTDTWKTEEGYMSLMAKVFAVLEKALKPKQEMEEDHGTAVHHDHATKISKDHSELEDTVYEGAQDWNHTWEEDIMDLLDDGVSKPEILTHFKDILKNADSRMEESVEDQDPFGSIKTGIDKIAKGGEENIDDQDRFYDMGGDQIKAGIESLIDDGFDFREIIDFVKQVIIANKRK